MAIADVSHYVKDGDPLDRDARERGTSVYFPRRVIPMLPEALSNELCSLKPDVDRLCMVCDMEVTAEGAIRKHRFYPAVMHSRARLTYTQVWNWLADPKSVTREAKALLPQLADLYALFHALKRAREARGAIDFDSVEMQLEFDVQGKIVRIVPVVRNDAHKLIEECMLAANVCTAEFLAAHKHPALYRVHEGPTPEKLAALRDFLASCALALPGGDEPDGVRLREAAAADQGPPRLRAAADGAAALAAAGAVPAGQRRPLRPLLRGLRALHVADPPLSRTCVVHRAIKAVLAGREYKPAGTSWTELGVHCSLTERRADDATRDVENWLKCYFMQDKVGETFDGTISGVTNFGIFVTLDGLNIDGLVHVTELGRDYFHFDAGRHAMVGERSGRIFQLAGRVRVMVARVDLETTKIDFTLADAPATLPSAPGTRAGQTARPRARIAPAARPPSDERPPRSLRSLPPGGQSVPFGRPGGQLNGPHAHCVRCPPGGSQCPSGGRAGTDRRTGMDLVIQASAIRAADVAAIASLTGAHGIHALGSGTPEAFRLARAQPHPGVAALCAAAGIDHAFVPAGQTRDRVRVVAMDMDSTLITIECIDEIADGMGIKQDVAAITAAAMRGEIDFAESLMRRVALLSGLPVGELERVYAERLELSPGAERMLEGFKAAGAKTLLVSGGFTFFTDRLKARLDFDAAAANVLEIAGWPPDRPRRAADLRRAGEGCAPGRDAGTPRRRGRHRGRDRRRRQRRADAESGRCVDRVSRETRLARAGNLCDRPLRSRRGAESVRVTVAQPVGARLQSSKSPSSIHAIWIASRIFSPLCFGSSSNPGSSSTHRLRSVNRMTRGSTSGCCSESAIAISRMSVHFIGGSASASLWRS